MPLLLLLLSFAQVAFGIPCPKDLALRNDGRCHYSLIYLNNQPQTGLQKPFPYSDEGINPGAINLGRLLFFDPILSRDKNLSCAHCHQPSKGFSDGLPRSHGRNGNDLLRGAPTLWNVAFSPALFWDGRSHTLEQQAEGPLYSQEEMGMSPWLVEQRLNEIPEYRRLFQQVFDQTSIKSSQVIKAIASFERTLISFNSRYDHYVFGDFQALNGREVEGLNVFRSFVTRCTECHTPPLFTNYQAAILGVPDPNHDKGMGNFTGNTKLNGAFRVPTLRNIALTAPYMHDGIFPTLESVIDFYDQGGGRHLENPSPYIHWHIREMGLSDEEKRDLSLFLQTLTDESDLPEIPNEVPSGLKPLQKPSNSG